MTYVMSFKDWQRAIPSPAWAREALKLAPWMSGNEEVEKTYLATTLRYSACPLGVELVETCPKLGPADPIVVTSAGLRDWFFEPRDEDLFVYDNEKSLDFPLPQTLKLAFGSIAAVSILRSVFKIYVIGLRQQCRRIITNELGYAPCKSTNYRLLRDAFNSTPLFEVQPNPNHSHGRSASVRTEVVRFTQNVAFAAGLETYCYQMSNRDQSNNMRGERIYYWAKDVAVLPQYDEVCPTDLITMVDVDYYLDMNERLVNNPKPHLLYTVVPETAGRTTQEYSYSFTEDNKIRMTVSGGASYEHELYNYCVDWFTVTRKNWFGIPVATVVYDVCMRRTSPDRAAVMLSPMRAHYGLAAIFSHYMGRPLERLKTYVHGGFSKVRINHDGNRTTSVARAGSETSCTITTDTFNILKSTRNISPQTKLSLYQVKQHISNDNTASPILVDYFNNTVDPSYPELWSKPRVEMVKFSFITPGPSDKPSMVAFGAPMVPPAFVPLLTPDNADQAIRGRVIFPREQVAKVVGEFKMTESKLRAAREFVQRLVPKPGIGVPLDYDSVAEKQARPGQKKDLQDANFTNVFVNIVVSFMKKEAYGKPTDPRNITTFQPKSKIDYAAFMYPIMDHLKTYPFYAFGITPLEVATRVASIAQRSSLVVCPDISRMDGYVNAFCRLLEQAVGLRFFAPEHAAAFAEAHSEAFDNIGVTSAGTKYDQGKSRGSGEMGTSSWNTVINLFILYLAAYRTTSCFDAAWKVLTEQVLAGGDDGLVGDVPEAQIIRAARDVGFIMKTPTYTRGEVGVNFLARVYGPDVWNGDPTSMCSLRRQCEKFHLTPAVPLSAADKLCEKAVSFSLTDSQTPVIGNLVTKVLKLRPGYVPSGLLSRYGDNHAIGEQYPNGYDDWMMQVAEEELPLVNISALLSAIDSAASLDDLLHLPACYEEGREFTYDEWDPESGLLIAKTMETLGLTISKPTTKRKEKRTRATASLEMDPKNNPLTVDSIKFGCFDDDEDVRKVPSTEAKGAPPATGGGPVT